MIAQLPRRSGRVPRAGLLLFAGLLAATGITVAQASPAAAATAAVTVSPGTADPDYATRLQLSGSGFQSVQNGFGGVYVLFGWVDTKWRPSQGGVSGTDFVYVQDSEAKDNHGFQRFVSFPGDPTGYAANGGQVKADGTWSTTLIVPGATFPAQGRNGGIEQIDCRKVQCGVITIGGHGVVSPSNETFTPVSFAAPQGAPLAAATTTPVAPTRPATAPAVTPAPVASVAPAAKPASTTAPSAAAAKSASPVAAASANAAPTTPPAEISETLVAAERSTSMSAIGWLLAALAVGLVVAGSGRWWLRRRSRGSQS